MFNTLSKLYNYNNILKQLLLIMVKNGNKNRKCKLKISLHFVTHEENLK